MTAPAAPSAPLLSPLDAALYYATVLGWSVFPLHVARGGVCSCPDPQHGGKPGGARCESKGKHPRISRGLKGASKDPAQIRAWWRRWPDAPVGVVTGEASGFVVLDIDVSRGKQGRESLARLEAENGALPPTSVSITGSGGSHLLFALPGSPLANSGSKVGQGLDVRATGGYIVAPPSSHESGGVYQWQPGAEPWTLPLAPMPLWLFERARNAPRLVPEWTAPAYGDHPLSERIKRASAYLARIKVGAVSGQGGHDAAFSVALPIVRGFDLPRDVAIQLLWEEYNHKCQPPWSRAEIEHKVDGALVPGTDNPAPLGYLLDDSRRVLPPPRLALSALADTPEAARASWDEEAGEVQDAYEPDSAGPQEAPAAEAPPPTSHVDSAPNAPPLPEPEHLIFTRGDHTEIASALLLALGPTPVAFDEGDFWRYNPAVGAWSSLSIPTVEQVVTTFAGAQLGTGKKATTLKINSTTVKGATHLARVALLAGEAPISFSAAARGVAFRNGFAVVRAGKVTLAPHAPSNACRFAFPFDYDPDAKYLELSEFFETVFGDASEEERADRVALIQEFVGASLIGEAPIYQRCLVLFGPGGNGKGEVLRIMRGLFPPHAVVSLPPQHWGERFQVARLVGALANFVDEIPERDITSGDIFKSVITGDPTHAERKGETPFEFRPIAGNVFNANALPGSVDRSDGFWRRFAVCPFTRNLAEMSERRLAAGAAVLAACLPGCVRWALEGAARAQTQAGYTISEKSREIVEKWRDENDPVRLFLRQRQGQDTDWIGATIFYRQFVEWARENGHAQCSSTKFGRSMTSIGTYERQDFATGRSYRRKAKASKPAAKTAE